MNRWENPNEQIVDNRERCPACGVILPSHKGWCVTPVIEGERTQETLEIEGEQSVVLQEADNG